MFNHKASAYTGTTHRSGNSDDTITFLPGCYTHRYQRVKIQKGRVGCNQILMNSMECDFKIIPGRIKFSFKALPRLLF